MGNNMIICCWYAPARLVSEQREPCPNRNLSGFSVLPSLAQLNLAKWSIVVTDTSLRNIAKLTHDRVTADIARGPERKKYMTLEEEVREGPIRLWLCLLVSPLLTTPLSPPPPSPPSQLSQLSSLSFEPTEEVEVTQKLSKRKTRLERTLEER